MFALLQAAMLVHIEWTNIFAHNSEAENLTDLKLVYLSVSFNSLPSWRQALNSFDFLFQWRDNESSRMTSTIQNGALRGNSNVNIARICFQLLYISPFFFERIFTKDEISISSMATCSLTVYFLALRIFHGVFRWNRSQSISPYNAKWKS